MSSLTKRAPAWLLLLALGLGSPVHAQEQPPATPEAKPPSTPEPIPNEPWRPNDKRRTVRSYWRNLRHNVVGVVSPENGKALFHTLALTLPSYALDDNAIDYFSRHPHPDYARYGARFGGSIAAAGMTIGFFSAGRYAHNDRFRAATYDISQAVIIAQLYTTAAKYVFRRERPDGSNRLSFPSGHSSNAFAVAAVAAHHYPHLLVPAYALSSAIAISRLAANKHHVSDIVAGSGLGFSVGKIVVHRNGRPPDTPPLKSMWIAPDAGPSGDGVGLALRMVF